MKHYKTSIVSSLIAGILICGMLAACGAAEKQQDDNLSDNKPPVNNVSDDQQNDPGITDTDDTDPGVTDPGGNDTDDQKTDDADPENDVPEVDVTVPDTDEPDNTEPEENDRDDVLDSNIANIIVETATAQLGVPYASGGSSPEKGFDSSGFVYYCIRNAGIDFPRSTKDQVNFGTKIGYSDLAPGDAVYFSAEPGGSASFCGVYVGGGLIIYAPVPGDNVKTANITTNYWTSRFVTGIRPAN